MQITTCDMELRVDNDAMRTYVAAPKEPGQYPGILLYSEIFQLTGPIRRSCERLAGHGFVVAAPEIYHRIEQPGTVIAYDDIGRIRGNQDAARTPVAAFDADCAAVLAFLNMQSNVASDKLGAIGFCIGGHLAFRAALQPLVLATVCCYPTGVHNGKLGQDADAGTFARLGDIKGELLVVFGKDDPHVPEPARQQIAAGLAQAGVRHQIQTYAAEHAFMRDEGYRYDSAAADSVWAGAVAFYQRIFS
jgi:carboxymethylenebutenolidase